MVKRYLQIGMTVVCLVLLLTIGTSSPKGVVADSILSPEGGPPLTDGFTYQGYLEENGVPVNGLYDFEITVWTDAIGGVKKGTSQSLTGQWVDNGIFSFNIYLDASNQYVFNGYGRWIQVQVKENGTSTWTTLARQPVTAVPYAWSLRPGAVIKGAVNGSILEVENLESSGTLGDGIRATTSSSSAPAIAGYHTGDGPAIYGSVSGAYPAVEGIHDGDGTGVAGFTEGGIGAAGTATNGTGYGVSGMQNAAYPSMIGYWKSGGVFGGKNGAIGFTNESGGYAVLGHVALGSSNIAWAGYFWNMYGNGVKITAASGSEGLTVAGGTKSAVVATDDGARLMYSEESTEVWFSDYGFGQLEKGETEISIDPTFAQTVNLEEPYHVFVQVYGVAEVYVSDRTADSFRVVLIEGDDAVEFSYKIQAIRLGYEGDRMERSPSSDHMLNDVNFVSADPQIAEQYQ